MISATTNILTQERITTANKRLAKKRVQCLNEALCFYSSSVLVDSEVLRIENQRSSTRPNAKLENA